MTVKVDIDTSQEATDAVAYAVAQEMFGSTASPGLRLEVRKIVLTVAEILKHGNGTQTGEQS